MTPTGYQLLKTRVAAVTTACERFAHRTPSIFSFAIVAGLFVFTLSVVGSSFQTNDDPVLAMIASGQGISLAPDEHLIFSNVAIGHVLKRLYTSCPAVPWYAVYLYLAQYLAQVALLYCTIARCYSRLRLGIYLLFFATIGAVFVTSLQFTTTASLVTAAGLLLCIVALRERKQHAPNQLATVLACGVGLAVLGSLIRLECFYMMALLAIPAAILWIDWQPRKAVLLPAATCLGACLACVFAFAAYNDAYYQATPEWRDFLRFNQLRVKFNDYQWTQYTPETQSVFDEVDWTANDHAMISHWFYDDPQVFDEQRLERVLNAFPWQSWHQTPGYWWSCIRTILRDRTLWAATLAMPLVFWCSLRSKRNLTAYLASITLGVGLLICIAMFNKAPPSRVYFPVVTFPALLLLLLVREQFVLPGSWSTARPGLCRAMVVAAVVGVLYGGTQQMRRVGRVDASRADLLQTLAELPASEARLFVIYGPGFPYETLSPWDNLSRFANLHQVILGWPQRTPLSDAMKRHHRIKDLASALFQRTDLVLVGHPTFHPLLDQFIFEHHGMRTRFDRLSRHRSDLVAGRIRPEVDERSLATSPTLAVLTGSAE